MLSDLQAQGDSNLSEKQIQKIKEANQVLKEVELHTHKKKIDWNTILTLGMQAASLIIEMLKSG